MNEKKGQETDLQQLQSGDHKLPLLPKILKEVEYEGQRQQELQSRIYDKLNNFVKEADTIEGSIDPHSKHYDELDEQEKFERALSRIRNNNDWLDNLYFKLSKII